MKPNLLLLCHRIPYPPNRGDKIRSFNLLKFLSQHYRVHLGCFIDDSEDWQHVAELKSYCASTCFVNRSQSAGLLRAVLSLFTHKPLSLAFFASSKLHKWVGKTTASEAIEYAVVFSSTMAQYVVAAPTTFSRKIIDFIDVDSAKWQQFAVHRRWPLSWVYRREAKLLHAYEKTIASTFDASFFVSAHECQQFLETYKDIRQSVGYFANGVDTDYFNPALEYASPYSTADRALVFTGSMNYWPNEDAVTWFANEVFPALKASNLATHFYIVGSKPPENVRKLAALPGVHVTGAVPDVRPYLHHAFAAVAPMRVAPGVQNKVLEAMAMAKPVIASQAALAGITAKHGSTALIANRLDDFMQCLQDLALNQYPEMGKLARHYAVNTCNWSQQLEPLTQALDGNSDPSPASNHA